MKIRNALIVVTMAAAGVTLGALILSMEPKGPADPHEHGGEAHVTEGHTNNGGGHQGYEGETEQPRGPRGGRLFGEDFQVEVTIFEDGVPPRFRVYGYVKGEPVKADDFDVSITLHRLGADPQTINLRPQDDYLLGEEIVHEPHSFDVDIKARFQGGRHEWGYQQTEGRVRLSQKEVEEAGIRLEEAGPRKLAPVLSLPGEVRFNQDLVAHVVPRIDGVVSAVNKQLGDQVRQGEVLAVIESRELAQLQGRYLAALRSLDLAMATHQREERLWEQGNTAEQDYLQAKQGLAEAEIERDVSTRQLTALGFNETDLKLLDAGELKPASYEIRAPQRGTVVEKHITLGEAVGASAHIFTIADTSTLWGVITVYAEDLPNVRLGQKVMVRSEPMNMTAIGSISFIDAAVVEQTQSVTARVDIPNPDGVWRSGLFVTMEVRLADAPVPVAVRRDALQSFRDWTVVFARFVDQFEVRPLKLGRGDDQWVEVVEGLDPGQMYAASNSYLLKADLGKAGASHDH